MSDTIVTSLRIKPEILKDARICALENEITLGKFIESAILHEIQRIKK
jgi:hypothetical protein